MANNKDLENLAREAEREKILEISSGKITTPNEGNNTTNPITGKQYSKPTEPHHFHSGPLESFSVHGDLFAPENTKIKHHYANEPFREVTPEYIQMQVALLKLANRNGAISDEDYQVKIQEVSDMVAHYNRTEGMTLNTIRDPIGFENAIVAAKEVAENQEDRLPKTFVSKLLEKIEETYGKPSGKDVKPFFGNVLGEIRKSPYSIGSIYEVLGKLSPNPEEKKYPELNPDYK